MKTLARHVLLHPCPASIHSLHHQEALRHEKIMINPMFPSSASSLATLHGPHPLCVRSIPGLTPTILQRKGASHNSGSCCWFWSQTCQAQKKDNSSTRHGRRPASVAAHALETEASPSAGQSSNSQPRHWQGQAAEPRVLKPGIHARTSKLTLGPPWRATVRAPPTCPQELAISTGPHPLCKHLR